MIFLLVAVVTLYYYRHNCDVRLTLQLYYMPPNTSLGSNGSLVLGFTLPTSQLRQHLHRQGVVSLAVPTIINSVPQSIPHLVFLLLPLLSSEERQLLNTQTVEKDTRCRMLLSMCLRKALSLEMET